MLSLVVPATPECTLDVYKQAMNISEQGFPEYERVELLSHLDTGEPILIRANVFDFYSDILVVLTDNYGKEYEYSPYTSLKEVD